MFKVQNKNLKKTKQFIEDALEDRFEAFEHAFLRRLGEAVLEEIKSKVPAQGLLASYRDALKLASIKGDTPAVAIVADLPADLETIRHSNEFVILFPLLGGGLDEPAAQVLHQYEPWTFDQVPPVTITQPVTFKKMAEDEVAGFSQARAADQGAAVADLKKQGVQLGERFIVNGKAQIDVASLAMRAEFGGPGSPRYPHWRPAIARIVQGVTIKKVLADAEFVTFVQKTMTDPKFGGWKSETKPLDMEITPDDIEAFKKFAGLVSP